MSFEEKNDFNPTDGFENDTNGNNSQSHQSEGSIIHHVLVLIHGIKGNSKEMGYIKKAIGKIYRRSSRRKSSKLTIYSAKCNEKNSLDGIGPGGLRFAREINDLLPQVGNDIVSAFNHECSDIMGLSRTLKNTKVALSILGYSMGGLYGRFAIKYIDWKVPVKIGSTIVNLAVVPHIFATIATPHLGMNFKIPECLQPLVGIIFGQSGNDIFRRNASKMLGSGTARQCRRNGNKDGPDLELNGKPFGEYECNDIIEILSFDPDYLRPLSRFSRRIAYANAFSTDVVVPTATAAFLFDDDDDDDGASCDRDHKLNSSNSHNSPATPPESTHSPHLFVSEFHDKTKTVNTHIENHAKDKGTKRLFIRFDTMAAPHKRHVKVDCKNPPSVSDMGRSLDSLGWSKIFIDARPHIPTLWKRSNGQRHGSLRNSFEDLIGSEACDNNQENALTHTSAELKRKLSGNGFHWSTSPFGHSFIIASTKTRLTKILTKSARPIVDRAIAQEVVNEMVLFESSYSCDI